MTTDSAAGVTSLRTNHPGIQITASIEFCLTQFFLGRTTHPREYCRSLDLENGRRAMAMLHPAQGVGRWRKWSRATHRRAEQVRGDFYQKGGASESPTKTQVPPAWPASHSDRVLDPVQELGIPRERPPSLPPSMSFRRSSKSRTKRDTKPGCGSTAATVFLSIPIRSNNRSA
jgi:hypothetical protein